MSDTISQCDSEYDDPKELDQDIIQKYSFSPSLDGTKEEMPKDVVDSTKNTTAVRKVLVNNVAIDQDHQIDSLSEQPSDEDESAENDLPLTNSMIGLKRFSGFQGALNEIGSSDDDVGCHGNVQGVDVGHKPVQEFDDDVDATLSSRNRTLDETIEEIEVELEKKDGSFGFSIHVSYYKHTQENRQKLVLIHTLTIG